MDPNHKAKIDAHLRDLTINSMFYNITTGQIEDFTGKGYADLKTMTLRTPLDPQKTFADDPLRLLRVLRFYSRYKNSTIAPEVIDAMRDSDIQNQIVRKIINPDDQHGIVVERTAEELRKIMTGAQPEAAIRIMYEAQDAQGNSLLSRMLNLHPRFHRFDMAQRNKYHDLTVIEHTLEVIKNMNQLAIKHGLPDDQRMLMNVSSLFHDIGKLDPRSHKVKSDGSLGFSGDFKNNQFAVPHEVSSAEVWSIFAKAMQFSNHEHEFVRDVVVNHMKPHGHIGESSGAPASEKTLRKYIRENPNWVYHYFHAMADSLSKNKLPDPTRTGPYEEMLAKMRNLNPNADAFGKAPKQKDLLSGQEIIALVGLPPAPPPGKVGYIEKIKRLIRDEQDGNPQMTKDQATLFVQNLLPQIHTEYAQI